jgi:hypothetical protein
MMLYAGPRISALLPGGDPAPGDGDEITRVITQLRGVVDTVEAARKMLNTLGQQGSAWTGPGADAVAARRGDLLQRLNSAHDAYDSAANALATWLRQLQLSQSDAAGLVVRTNEYARQATATQPINPFGPTLTPVPPELVRLRQEHKNIADIAERNARQCAQALHDAIRQVDPYRRSGWDHFLEHLVQASRILHDVDNVLSAVSLTLMLVSVVPIVGEIAFVAVIGFGAATLVVDAVLAANHRQKWSEVGMDALDLGLAGAGGVGEKIARRTLEADQLAAGARGATEVAARQSSAFSWLLHHGDTALAGTVGAAAGATWITAGRLAAKSDELRRGAAIGSGLGETASTLRAPGAAVNDFNELNQLIQQSEGFAKLPRLQRWVPSTVKGQVGAGLHVGDAINDAKHVVDFVKEQLEQPEACPK